MQMTDRAVAESRTCLHCAEPIHWTHSGKYHDHFAEPVPVAPIGTGENAQLWVAVAHDPGESSDFVGVYSDLDVAKRAAEDTGRSCSVFPAALDVDGIHPGQSSLSYLQWDDRWQTDTD